MNKFMIGLLFSLATAANSMAASNKVCFGSTKNDDTKGVVLKVRITKKTVTIKTIKESSNFSYNGTYPAYNTSVEGKDGKTYLQYEGESTDYQDIIMVDEALLQDSTKGLLQIRARGEGFFNNVFVCKDDENRE